MSLWDAVCFLLKLQCSSQVDLDPQSISVCYFKSTISLSLSIEEEIVNQARPYRFKFSTHSLPCISISWERDTESEWMPSRSAKYVLVAFHARLSICITLFYFLSWSFLTSSAIFACPWSSRLVFSTLMLTFLRQGRSKNSRSLCWAKRKLEKVKRQPTKVTRWMRLRWSKLGKTKKTKQQSQRILHQMRYNLTNTPARWN